jgi:hypothetical protein
MSVAAGPKRWVCLVKRKVENLEPTYLPRRVIRVRGVTWGGRKKRIDINWIASDGSVLVPTTDLETTLP